MSTQPNHPPLSLSAKALRTQEQPISYLIAAALQNPRLISLAAGLVDNDTLPVEPARLAVAKILGNEASGRAALQYDTTRGLPALREAVLGRLETMEGISRGQMSLTADDVLVSTGSQQALYLVAESLLDVGDIVITANPSYFVYASALESFGAQIVPVPMDDGGMDVDEIEAKLAEIQSQGQLHRVKYIYCTSYFQNPTGLSLAADRRARLLAIVKKYSRTHRILILEDAAYRELRYDGPVMRSIKSYDPENKYTILTQTFSKPFAPGIKTGYTFLPADLMAAVLEQKGSHDFGSPNLCQQIALQVLTDGSYDEHLQVILAGYRKKRDIMLHALHMHMPTAQGLKWTTPQGGLYVWLTLPAAMDTSRHGPIFRSCLEKGMLYVPGDYCLIADKAGHRPLNQMRLSFGTVVAEQIEPAIRILAEVVQEQLDQSPTVAVKVAGAVRSGKGGSKEISLPAGKGGSAKDTDSPLAEARG